MMMEEESNKEGETLIGACTSSDNEDFDAEFELSGASNGRLPASQGSVGIQSGGGACCSNCYVITASLMASLGGVLFGYDIGIISGAVLQLRDVFCLSCLDQELVISAMLMGAMLGSFIGGFLMDHCGRRSTIIGNSVVFLLGALILGFAPNFGVLVVGRLLVGFAVSVSATAECIYISEIAPPKQRGLLVSFNELGITVGLLLAYLCNFLLIDASNGWRWMFALSAVPAVVQGVGMVFLPRSPRFLMLKRREDEAEGVLKKLRGSNRVENEISAIRVSIANEKNQRCLDLCSGQDGMRGRMFIGVGLVFFQQFTGQPNVLYYAPTIFEDIGFRSDSAATLATVGLGIVKVVMTVIALVCVDKIGRRKLLCTGSLFMGISIIALGTVCHFEQGTDPQKACVDHSSCSSNDDHSHMFLSSTFQALSKHNISLNTSTSAVSAFMTQKSSVILKQPFYANESNEIQAKSANRENDFGSSKGDNQTDKKHNATNNNGILKAKGDNTSDGNIFINQTKGTNLDERLGIPKGYNNSDGNVSTGKINGSKLQRAVGFVALMCYVAAYGFSFGPVTWLVLSEIFPAAVKGRAIAMATVFNWGTNLIVTFTFLDIMNGVGVTWTFILFGLICFLSLAFIFAFVPETKNRTLEQISSDLKANPSSIRMRRNCGWLLCCIDRQQSFGNHGNYSRVESETVT
ncbi:solute carrier family 2, facilitated glucose transporter member 10-like isoform X2 [Dreissena polymorpha]|uniref:Major facilitator superfamily (MFS) profile domain-containing protein n=1 Tax=Dreissena polymorpha TaxID=45954 RepID=A0A9D4EN31_DREPO|nr:solute carrier family 2, facilitated glucose transporter member 10-like isoform X2 [Dreissena polymorpha]KAH3782648.1 hypothetical protein DPMN_160567 [Dreissena polymorpha]